MSSAAAEIASAANRYKVLAKLASGGMAEIFLARGEGVAGVERYCVLKRILRDRASDAQFVRMFLDEARLAAQLHHPNIAQVYDIGKLGDSYFFTMEYVHGETVRALLHRAQGLRRPLPISCVLTIVAGAAAGLHHAHVRVGVDGRALGIVHRDVSPSNLMVSYEGGVKVVDFGVAKADDRAQETRTGTVKGKISYLSPEQCRGKRVDRRSDLFSLGICFWEMLTTERLYRRSSDFENMTAIVSEPPPRPSSRRPDVPPEIDELVLRLLAKSPDGRFQTADELVDAVEVAAARTGSVLSASGLGRFMRELFGSRPEPWLELDGQHGHRVVTMAGEPVPHEIVSSPAEPIDRQLSSVVELSTPCSVTESLEPGQVEVSVAQPGAHAQGGGPLAPPSAGPGILPGAAPASSAGPPPASRDTDRVLPAVVGVSAGAQFTGPAPRPQAYTPSSGQVVPPAPPAVLSTPPVVLPAPPVALPAPPVVLLAPPVVLPAPPVVLPAPPVLSPGPWAAPVGSGPVSIARPGSPSMSLVAISRPPSASPVSLSILRRPRRAAIPCRAGWPLYAVIGGAALVGSIAVMIVMRSGAAADDAATSATTAKATPMAIAGTVDLREPATGMPPSAGDHPDRPGDTIAAERSTGGGEEGATERSAGGGEEGATERSAGGGVEGATERSAGGGEEGATATPPPHGPTPAAPARPPAKRTPRTDEIPQLYARGQYGEVVDHCEGPVNADHAPLCFLAACRTGDSATAHRLISAIPAVRREQLIANCLQFGLDIARASECEAHPMDCQH